MTLVHSKSKSERFTFHQNTVESWITNFDNLTNDKHVILFPLASEPRGSKFVRSMFISFVI